MRASLCWFCNRVCECDKVFPNGRPRGKDQCADFLKMPPSRMRITYQEIADILDCSVNKIKQLTTSIEGICFLSRALEKKGLLLSYERKNSRTFFYKEDI